MTTEATAWRNRIVGHGEEPPEQLLANPANWRLHPTEQQRALAILNERELLARELHDNLGQVLGYVSVQAQAIRKRAQGGDLPAVETQLTRLAQVAQAAHADIR